MTTTIAVAGKGGTGKTTLAGLLIRRLAEAQAGPILAIDADPASNLNTVLDLPLEKTVGDVREETSEKARANLLEAGIAKSDLLDYEINSSLVEGVNVDLLAMGRPEGPGCYCAANNMLRAHHRQDRRQLPVGRHRQRGRAGASLPAHDPRRRRALHRQRRDGARHHDRRSRRRAAGGAQDQGGAALPDREPCRPGSLARARGGDRRATASTCSPSCRTTRRSPSSTPPASRSSACRPTAH